MFSGLQEYKFSHPDLLACVHHMRCIHHVWNWWCVGVRLCVFGICCSV